MSRILVIVFILLSFQASSGGLTISGPSMSSTIEELDTMAFFLMKIADGKAKKDCGIKAEDAFLLMNSLKALIDEKFKAIKGIPKSWENCSRSCHCGVYERYIETLNIKKLSSQDQLRAKLIFRQAQKIQKCNEPVMGLCESSLLKYLRNESN